MYKITAVNDDKETFVFVSHEADLNDETYNFARDNDWPTLVEIKCACGEKISLGSEGEYNNPFEASVATHEFARLHRSHHDNEERVV